jgi:hypothetical protein
MSSVVHVDFHKAGKLNLERFIAFQLSEDLKKVLGHERTDVADLVAAQYTKCLHRVRDLFDFSLKFDANAIPVEQAEITRRVFDAAVRAVATELGAIRDEIAIEIGTFAHAVMIDTAISLDQKDNGAA